MRSANLGMLLASIILLTACGKTAAKKDGTRHTPPTDPNPTVGVAAPEPEAVPTPVEVPGLKFAAFGDYDMAEGCAPVREFLEKFVSTYAPEITIARGKCRMLPEGDVTRVNDAPTLLRRDGTEMRFELFAAPAANAWMMTCMDGCAGADDEVRAHIARFDERLAAFPATFKQFVMKLAVEPRRMSGEPFETWLAKKLEEVEAKPMKNHLAMQNLALKLKLEPRNGAEISGKARITEFDAAFFDPSKELETDFLGLRSTDDVLAGTYAWHVKGRWLGLTREASNTTIYWDLVTEL